MSVRTFNGPLIWEITDLLSVSAIRGPLIWEKTYLISVSYGTGRSAGVLVPRRPSFNLGRITKPSVDRQTLVSFAAYAPLSSLLSTCLTVYHRFLHTHYDQRRDQECYLKLAFLFYPPEKQTSGSMDHPRSFCQLFSVYLISHISQSTVTSYRIFAFSPHVFIQKKRGISAVPPCIQSQ